MSLSIERTLHALVTLVNLHPLDIIYFCRANKQFVQLCKSNSVWERLIERDYNLVYPETTCGICEYTRLTVENIIYLYRQYIGVQNKVIERHDQVMDDIREDWAYEHRYTTMQAFTKAINSERKRYERAIRLLEHLESTQQNILADFQVENVAIVHNVEVPFTIIKAIVKQEFDEDPETLVSLLLLQDELKAEIDYLTSNFLVNYR